VDHETPELIESQMAETRQSLTDKVAALEDSVVGKVQTATTAVHDTVRTVRDAVEGTVESVRENVSSVLDVSRHVQDRPWTMVGGAAALGLVVGVALPHRRGDKAPAAFTPRTVAAVGGPPTPGVFDRLLDRLGAEVAKLSESAIASLSVAIRRAVDEGLPRMVDRLTERPATHVDCSAEPSTHPIGRWNGA